MLFESFPKIESPIMSSSNSLVLDSDTNNLGHDSWVYLWNTSNGQQTVMDKILKT